MFLAFADIASVNSEQNLEKRSVLAMDNADRAVTEARAAYQAGDMKKTEAAVAEIRQSVDTSLDALENSGKEARNSKYYKHVEIRLRELQRRLSGLRDEMSVDDRKPIDDLITRVQEVHDRVLADIMSKKKKR